MRYWLSGHQWVISESLVTLQLTVDYVLGQLMCETARFDATVVVESMVVDEMMPGLTCLILGFGIM